MSWQCDLVTRTERPRCSGRPRSLLWGVAGEEPGGSERKPAPPSGSQRGAAPGLRGPCVAAAANKCTRTTESCGEKGPPWPP